jgi:hypothetical protein
MEIIETNYLEYDEIFNKPIHQFNTGAFNNLNRYKTEKVHYLIFKDNKVRLGIIFGVKQNILHSPFSAPFGGFQNLNEDIGLEKIDLILKTLNEWVKVKKIDGIKITFPPLFYNFNFLTKLNNAFYRSGFKKINSEINYQFTTLKMDENYSSIIWKNAKKNLNKSLRSELTFEKIDQKNGFLAYNIISENRNQRGFPLRMTWDQLELTSNTIKVDYFIVKKQETPVASAIVFHVSEKIVQVVYWGDLPKYSEYKNMNFLSFNIFNYYKENCIEIIDIGPSTEESIPNYGLCEFKESIGCDLIEKSSFYKK